MATLGDLVVNLKGNTQNFEKSMRRSESRLQSFKDKVSTVAKVTAGAGLAAVGIAAAKVAQQFEKLDVIAKTSDKLGIAADRIGGLQLAFEQTGVSVNAGMVAMQRMTRRISEAANGSGPAVKALNELGLSAQSLEDMSPDKALGSIADALQSVGNQSDRVRLAFSLFDSEGVGLVNTLSAGSAGLEHFQSQADRLNLNHTREELANIEKANDAMNLASRAVTGSLQKMAIVAGPVVEKIANGFGIMIDAMNSFGASIAHTVGFGQTSFGELYQSLERGITTAMAVGEWAMQNFQDITQLVFKSNMAVAVTAFNTFKHFFTQQLPGYLSWFGDNWQSVFLTAFDFVSTGFINLSTNIQNAWRSILDYITGESDGLAFVWKPLSEGFKNTIAELPDIPERAISEFERNLHADAMRLENKLGKSLTASIADRVASLEGMQGVAAAGPKFTSFDPTGLSNGVGGGNGDGDSGGGPVGSTSREPQRAGLATQGSAAALSQIFKSADQKKMQLDKERNKLLKDAVANGGLNLSIVTHGF